MTRPTLLNLPKEIRDLVYDHVFEDTEFTIVRTHVGTKDGKYRLMHNDKHEQSNQYHVLVSVCGMVRDEVINRPLLWTNALIKLQPGLLDAGMRIPRHFARNIKHLYLKDSELKPLKMSKPLLDDLYGKVSHITFPSLPQLQNLAVQWTTIVYAPRSEGYAPRWVPESILVQLLQLMYFRKSFNFSLTILAKEYRTNQVQFFATVLGDNVKFVYKATALPCQMWEADILRALFLDPLRNQPHMTAAPRQQFRLFTPFPGLSQTTDPPNTVLAHMVAGTITMFTQEYGFPERLLDVKEDDIERLQRRRLISNDKWEQFTRDWKLWFDWRENRLTNNVDRE